MKLILLTGRSGSGRSSFIRDAMLRATADRRAFLVVPDQYTHECELAFREHGLFYAEVLGFSELARRVLSVAGGAAQKFLDADGFRMALRRVTQVQKHELKLLGGETRGALEATGEMLSSLKLGGVSPATLKNAAARATGLLRDKLSDLALLLEGMRDFTAGRFMDSADRNALVTASISEALFLRGADVYIDRVDRFEWQRLQLVRAMLSVASSVTVSLQTGEEPLFCCARAAQAELTALAESCGAQLFLQQPPSAYARAVPPAVAHIERRLFGDEAAGDPTGLTLVTAHDLTRECLSAAAHIRTLLQGGVRRGDVTVVAPASYVPSLRRAFSLCEIDFFLDEKRPFASHPAAEFILAALRSATGGFRMRDALIAAKSGFIISADDAERLENYVLPRGLRFLPKTPFTGDAARDGGTDGITDANMRAESTRAEDTRVETARAALMQPLEALAESLKGCGTALACARALYGFMQDCGLTARLNALCEELRSNGRFEYAAETAQAYKTLLTLLDQIVWLSGDMTPKLFLSVLEEGCAAHQTSILPQLTDQVEITTIERASMRALPHLVVLGANNGELPACSPGDEIINDADVAVLESLGVTAFLSSSVKLNLAGQQAYALLSRPTASLYVSALFADSVRPGELFEKLERMFGKALPPLVPLCRNHAFAELISAMRGAAAGNPQESAGQLYAWFSRYEPARLAAAEQALLRPRAQAIGADAAAGVYGRRTHTSVSRLEEFARCPFKHFVRYGLRPELRREYTETRADEGNFHHALFEAFFRSLSRPGVRALTRRESDALAQSIADGMAPSHNHGVLQSSGRMRCAGERMIAAAKNTLWAAVRQLQSGEFTPALLEAALDGDGLLPVTIGADGGTLKGVIDRVDTCETENGTYVRVFDYKTGDESFSFSELYAGVKLQLPLYAAAAGALGRIAGMFYLHISDPVADKDDETELEAALFKQYRLRGALLDDERACRAMDADAKESAASMIIPARFAKGTVTGPHVLTQEEFRAVLAFAAAKAAESLARIDAGDVRVAPYRLGQKHACAGCDYASICGFDAEREPAEPAAALKKAEFFERIAGHGAFAGHGALVSAKDAKGGGHGLAT